jgi:hypothetical protein
MAPMGVSPESQRVVCRARVATIALTPADAGIEATYLVSAGSPIGAIEEVDRPGFASRSQRGAPILWLSRHRHSRRLPATLERSCSAALTDSFLCLRPSRRSCVVQGREPGNNAAAALHLDLPLGPREVGRRCNQLLQGSYASGKGHRCPPGRAGAVLPVVRTRCISSRPTG